MLHTGAAFNIKINLNTASCNSYGSNCTHVNTRQLYRVSDFKPRTGGQISFVTDTPLEHVPAAANLQHQPEKHHADDKKHSDPCFS